MGLGVKVHKSGGQRKYCMPKWLYIDSFLCMSTNQRNITDLVFKDTLYKEYKEKPKFLLYCNSKPDVVCWWTSVLKKKPTTNTQNKENTKTCPKF